MSHIREGLRPGGRSARVQIAIHKAVNELITQIGSDAITVPMIANHAGVTPTTIYRRWGDLPTLLADVSLQSWQPETPPPDKGSLKADLYHWFEEFVDEMSSGPGRQVLKDVLASQQKDQTARCCGFTLQQVQHILQRAKERDDRSIPTVDDILDGVIGGLIYRIIFLQEPPSVDHLHRMIDRVLLMARADQEQS
ncbi:TetR/AcrR family transcriptional regulator [Celerinatantimonas yamalensis]|uniref:TetR/AcrR family transcriptional regulator n=1 Tax=Celerinatantimonas yamalensis TaxID=559956 RepID=A0ABW9G486_9GAMM